MQGVVRSRDDLRGLTGQAQGGLGDQQGRGPAQTRG